MIKLSPLSNRESLFIFISNLQNRLGFNLKENNEELKQPFKKECLKQLKEIEIDLSSKTVDLIKKERKQMRISEKFFLIQSSDQYYCAMSYVKNNMGPS